MPRKVHAFVPTEEIINISHDDDAGSGAVNASVRRPLEGHKHQTRSGTGRRIVIRRAFLTLGRTETRRKSLKTEFLPRASLRTKRVFPPNGEGFHGEKSAGESVDGRRKNRGRHHSGVRLTFRC